MSNLDSFKQHSDKYFFFFYYFLLHHRSVHLRKPALMEKYTAEAPSACHVQTRPAYQDPSANVLSYLNQLDPSRPGARRRHTPNHYRE